MGENVVIKAKKLTKVYDCKDVIKDCEIQVNKGSIYGLLGPNGAGKTTILKLLTGLVHPSSGNIEILGSSYPLKREEILKNLGILIENPFFYEHLSAKENLAIHLSYMGLKGDIEKTLIDVGLFNVGVQPVAKFSLGMRQRLGIARALVHNPQILVLDEPLNGLDPMGIRDMRELFLTLSKEYSITILISSHILSEIEFIADTVGIVYNGRLLEEIPMDRLKEEYPKGLESYFFNITEKKGAENYVPAE